MNAVFKNDKNKGTWVARSVKCLTLDLSLDLDLRVVSSSPMVGSTLGMKPSLKKIIKCARFGRTYTKIGTIQRRLAWPLCKDDTQIREAFHILRGQEEEKKKKERKKNKIKDYLLGRLSGSLS